MQFFLRWLQSAVNDAAAQRRAAAAAALNLEQKSVKVKSMCMQYFTEAALWKHSAAMMNHECYKFLKMLNLISPEKKSAEGKHSGDGVELFDAKQSSDLDMCLVVHCCSAQPAYKKRRCSTRVVADVPAKEREAPQAKIDTTGAGGCGLAGEPYDVFAQVREAMACQGVGFVPAITAIQVNIGRTWNRCRVTWVRQRAGPRKRVSAGLGPTAGCLRVLYSWFRLTRQKHFMARRACNRGISFWLS